MGNINIAELLKDCPKGMELYSPIYGVGLLTKVTNRIHVKFPKEHNVKCFRLDGKVSEDGEIMLFPKGKTTWDGFVPPCKFKNGDIVSTNDGHYIFIFEGGIVKESDFYKGKTHFAFCKRDNKILDNNTSWFFNRLATEEEKQRLFNAIKYSGYKWNAETKTLEKLVEPRFKVGDRVKTINKLCQYDVTELTDTHYTLVEVKNKFQYTEQIIEDKNWELVPNKFDINTLVPFESRVLVRNKEEDIWRPAIFGCYVREKKYPYYVLGGSCWKQCIPCDCHRHLSGKTDDCDEYFKTWK